jgi:hypothetical protein
MKGNAFNVASLRPRLRYSVHEHGRRFSLRKVFDSKNFLTFMYFLLNVTPAPQE